MPPDEVNEYKKLIEIFESIDQLISKSDFMCIAIEGNSGAGKSTLAKFINSMYDSNLFHMDDFFLRPEQKTKHRLNEVGGNIDYERFNMEVINGLKSNLEFEYQTYNCQSLKLDKTRKIRPKVLNIIEGVYSMHPSIINIYDLKIFLKIDEKTQIERILKRNGELMLNRFINEWIPMENEYFRKMEIRDKSDIILRLP
ncbi:MAG: uridine kinase [Tissierella sp.]|nr:uridine kinase [Tissierella sp.]